MNTWETPAAKAAEAAAHVREPRDICALASQRTLLTQDEMVLAQTGLYCLLLSKNREVTCNPSGFMLDGSVHLK